MSKDRYCISQDGDGHWYLIPDFEREFFEDMIECEDDEITEAGWTWLANHSIDGPHRLTFTDPKEEGCEGKDVQEEYYIQRHASGYVGNNLVFWSKGGHGYGTDLGNAERFSEEAMQKRLQSDQGAKYRAWPCSYVDSKCVRTADHQLLDHREAIDYGDEPK